MSPTPHHPALRLLALALLLPAPALGVDPGAAAAPEPWPGRVLITNDDGIEDESRLVALAEAFHRRGAEVVVAVPREDRSGTGHFMTLVVRESRIAVERLRRHERAAGGPTTAFYVVDGYPADCVLFAFAGPMRDSLPDLVVSGINGGANLAEAWLGSGTIGAARIAAYAGIPALAVSGIDEDDPGAPGPLADWVARLAASDSVRNLPPRVYLTVALPAVPLAEMAGLRVARRSALRIRPVLTRRETSGDDPDEESWEISDAEIGDLAPDTDQPLYEEGFAVITPMRADEHDDALLAELAGRLDRLPSLVEPPSPPGE